MILEKLIIENFKGIKSASIEFSKNINIIIGKNNTGKTSILEALSLLFSSRYNQYVSYYLPDNQDEIILKAYIGISDDSNIDELLNNLLEESAKIYPHLPKPNKNDFKQIKIEFIKTIKFTKKQPKTRIEFNIKKIIYLV